MGIRFTRVPHGSLFFQVINNRRWSYRVQAQTETSRTFNKTAIGDHRLQVGASVRLLMNYRHPK